MIHGSRVEPGQVWETTDRRERGRQVHVDQVVPQHRYALVTTVKVAAGQADGYGEQTKVNIRSHGTREVLKGWRLVQHADGTKAGA